MEVQSKISMMRMEFSGRREEVQMRMFATGVQNQNESFAGHRPLASEHLLLVQQHYIGSVLRARDGESFSIRRPAERHNIFRGEVGDRMPA